VNDLFVDSPEIRAAIGNTERFCLSQMTNSSLSRSAMIDALELGLR
jgi:hypothetical protein